MSITACNEGNDKCAKSLEIAAFFEVTTTIYLYTNTAYYILHKRTKISEERSYSNMPLYLQL